MKVDITSVLKNSDERIDFDYQANLSSLELTYGERPARQPVRVNGSVFTKHGAVTLELLITGTLQLQCDRCTKLYDYSISCPFSAMVSADPDEEESEKLIVAENNSLDLDRLTEMALLVWLPAKHLCREDCKGLCPVCGADRNVTECDCEEHRIDLRLEGLKKFLE